MEVKTTTGRGCTNHESVMGDGGGGTMNVQRLKLRTGAAVSLNFELHPAPFDCLAGIEVRRMEFPTRQSPPIRSGMNR